MPRPASMFVATGVAARARRHGQVHPAQVQLDGADPALVVRCQCGRGRRRQPQVLLRPGRDPVQRRGERAPGQRHRQQRDRDQAAPRPGERPHHEAGPEHREQHPEQHGQVGQAAGGQQHQRGHPAGEQRERQRHRRHPGPALRCGRGDGPRFGQVPGEGGGTERVPRGRGHAARGGCPRQRGPRRTGSAPRRPGRSSPGPVARRRPGRCGCGAAGTTAWRRPRSAAGPRRGSATPRRGRPRPRSRSGPAARPCDSAGLVSRVRARRAAAPSRRCRAPRRCRRRPRRRNPPGRARDRCRSGVRSPRRRRRSAGRRRGLAGRVSHISRSVLCTSEPFMAPRLLGPGAPDIRGHPEKSAPRPRWRAPGSV